MKLSVGVSVSEERLALLVTKWGDKLLALRGSRDCPPTATAAELVEALTEYSFKDECVEWIVKTLVSGRSFWEDLPSLRVGGTSTLYLAKFFELRSQLPPPQRVLDPRWEGENLVAGYGSFADLVTVLNDKLGMGSATGAVTGLFDIYSAAPYAATLFDSSTFRVVQILNRDGALWWSWLWRERGPRVLPSWCTGWDTDTHYKNYTDAGPLFVVLDKLGVIGGRPDKWQLHLQSDQFKDRNDREVRRDDFTTNVQFLQALMQAPFSSADFAEHFTRIGGSQRSSVVCTNLLEYFSTSASRYSYRSFFNLQGYLEAQKLFNAYAASATTAQLNEIPEIAQWTAAETSDVPVAKNEPLNRHSAGLPVMPLLGGIDLTTLTPAAFCLLYMLYTSNRFTTFFADVECDLAQQLEALLPQPTFAKLLTALGHNAVRSKSVAMLDKFGFGAESTWNAVAPTSNPVTDSNQVDDFYFGRLDRSSSFLEIVLCGIMRNPATAREWYTNGQLFQLVLSLATNRAKFDALLNKLNQTNTAKLGFAPKDLLALTWHHFFATPLTWNPTLFYVATFGRSEPPGFWSKASKLSGADFELLLGVLRVTTDSSRLGGMLTDLNAVRPVPGTVVWQLAPYKMPPLLKTLQNYFKTQWGRIFVGKDAWYGITHHNNSLKSLEMLRVLATVPKLTTTVLLDQAPYVFDKIATYLDNTANDTDERTVKLRDRAVASQASIDNKQLAATAIAPEKAIAIFQKSLERGNLMTLERSLDKTPEISEHFNHVLNEQLAAVDYTNLVKTTLVSVLANYSWGTNLRSGRVTVMAHWLNGLIQRCGILPANAALDDLVTTDSPLRSSMPYKYSYAFRFGAGYKSVFDVAPLIWKLLLSDKPTPTPYVHMGKQYFQLPVTATFVWRNLERSVKLNHIDGLTFYLAVATDPARLGPCLLKYGLGQRDISTHYKLTSFLLRTLYNALVLKHPRIKALRVLLAALVIGHVKIPPTHLWPGSSASRLSPEIFPTMRYWVLHGKFPANRPLTVDAKLAMRDTFGTLWEQLKRHLDAQSKELLLSLLQHTFANFFGADADYKTVVAPVFRLSKTQLAKLP